jgi:geranyl-CoA carboxylase alpha subunit
MVAKFIAGGRDRAEAARRLASALDDEPLLGFPTNQHFLSQLLRSAEFLESSLATNTLDAWFEAQAPLFKRLAPSSEVWALAAALYADRGSVGDWFWSGNAFDFSLELDCGGERKAVRYRRLHQGTIAVSCEGNATEVTLIDASLPNIVFEASGVRKRAIGLWDGAKLHLSTAHSSFVISESDTHHAADHVTDGERITAPVAGLVLTVLAEAGQVVGAGQTLALIEAMKMETRVTAIHAGRVISVHAQAGAQIAMQALLFEIEKLDEPANV